MAFAIIRTGGKQFRVEPSQTLRVPSIAKKIGDSIEFDVLVMGGAEGGEGTKVGAPLVDGMSIGATIVGHGRADKIIVFKKKRRKQYKRKQGHRQGFTAIKIDSID